MNQVSKGATTQAPTGGLNALDSLVVMPAQDAVILRNLIPNAYGCTLRRGFREHATNFNGTVATLMAWNNKDGSGKLFAVDNAAIYECTTPQAIVPDVFVVESDNPWWQFTQFSNAAGVHTVAFNGINDGFWYSSAGYQALIAGDGTATGTWKNVDPKNLVNVVVHQKRIWAVEKDSTLGWYLPPEQVFGVATSFDFGGCFSRGGYLQAIATWTTDAGIGIDDKLLAISSRGEVAIYSGYDPEDPTVWKLEGVYQAGPTFSRRCWTKYGGDVALLTQYGVVTMSSLLSQVESVSQNSLSYKIQSLVSNYVAEGEYRAGWQITTYPNDDLLIVNVPGLSLSSNFQLAMNTITKAWCVLTGMAAACWLPFGSSMLFGSQQAVQRAFEGTKDNVLLDGTGGVPRRAEVQQAFNYFGAVGQNKHFKMFRPSFLFGGEFAIWAQANMEFQFGASPPPAGPTSTSFGEWDVDVWNGGSVWGGDMQNDRVWIFILGVGYAAAIRMIVESEFELTWVSTDWIFEVGGMV